MDELPFFRVFSEIRGWINERGSGSCATKVLGGMAEQKQVSKWKDPPSAISAGFADLLPFWFGYPLAGCSSAEPASVSPNEHPCN